MSKTDKNKLVPKLRFPHFKYTGEWEEKTLGAISTLCTEKVGNRKVTLISINAGIGLISQIEKFGREIAGASYKNYIVINKEDFAYNKSSTKYYPEGQIAMLENIEVGAVPNSIFTCFRVDKKIIFPNYLKFLFENNIHGKWLRKYIAIGARAHGSLNIDNKDLFSLPIFFPKLDEQQRIADCLSSIDDLINVHSQKLEALKDHKKALLQQLFPAEEETVPKLRFPEFEVEWNLKLLGEIAENQDSKRVPITENERIKGDIPYYGASGIIDYVKDYIYDDDLLCISEDGANLVARTYPIAFSITGKTWVNNHAHVLKFKSSFTQVLVENYLNVTNIEDYLTGMAQPKLNRGKLDIIPIPLPVKPDEQQKIADCLSLIDKLIVAQSQKLEALKSHKKGLMQQLFPCTNELKK